MIPRTSPATIIALGQVSHTVRSPGPPPTNRSRRVNDTAAARRDDVARLPRSGRAHRDLKRSVRATLRALEISSPLDLNELCDRLGHRRGRPLTVVGRALPVPGPSGLWIATEDSDTIVHQSQTSTAHQTLTIMHELGHVMAGHSSQPCETESGRSDEREGDRLLDELFPDLPREAVRSALRRQSYGDDQEYEAEMTGTIVLNWAGRLDYTSPPSASSAMGRRIQDSLGDHLGWR